MLDTSISARKRTVMNHRKEDLNRKNPTEETESDTEDTQRIHPQIRIQRIDDAQKRNDKNKSAYQTIASTTGEEERPRLRRTKMPSARVLERRERQRAMNERIRDTFFDRINGNFFPRDQIEE